MISPWASLRLGSSVSLFVLLLAGTSDVFAQPKPLRYESNPGQQLAYKIDISIDLPDKVTSYAGITRFTVDASNAEQIQLTYRGGLVESNKNKPVAGGGGAGGPRGPGMARGPRGIGGPPGGLRRGPRDFFSRPNYAGNTQTTNHITMSSRGAVAAMEGNSQLPFLLGNVSLIPFEILPAGNEREWNYDSAVSITKGNEDRRRPFGPFAQEDKTKIEAGKEVTKYSLVSQTDKNVVIKKTYELKKPKTPDEPALTLLGEGNWTFSLVDQMPEAFDFKEKLIVEIENAQITVPITIAMNRLTAEQLAKIDEEAAKARKDFEQKMADNKQQAEAPLTDDEKADVLSSLSSDDTTKIGATLKMLRAKSPKESDPEVVSALEPLAKHANPQLREDAQAALLAWSPDYKKKKQLNEAYGGHMPVESTDLEVDSKTSLFVGQIVQVRPQGSPFWNAAEILELLSNGSVKLRTRGLGAHEVTAKRNQIQLAPEEVDQPNKSDETTTASRTWVDNTGKHKTVATYLGVENGKVKLKKADGKEITIPLDKLSTADQKLVEKLQKAAKDSPNPFE